MDQDFKAAHNTTLLFLLSMWTKKQMEIKMFAFVLKTPIGEHDFSSAAN